MLCSYHLHLCHWDNAKHDSDVCPKENNLRPAQTLGTEQHTLSFGLKTW